MIKTISSSKVASLIATPPNGTPDQQLFGKKFEEAYQKMCWIWNDTVWSEIKPLPIASSNCPDCGQWIDTTKEDWIDDAIECSYCHRIWHDYCNMPMLHTDPRDRYTAYEICEDCIGREMINTFNECMGKNDVAQQIAIAFLRANVRGLTPRTEYAELKPNYYICAKPDLCDDYQRNIEFKTYAINDYARAQAKVFSWVYNDVIQLVGWNGQNVEIEIIDGRDMIIPLIPDTLFEESIILTNIHGRSYHKIDFDFIYEQTNDWDDDVDWEYDLDDEGE